MNAASMRPRAVPAGVATSLLATLIGLGVVACGGGSSSIGAGSGGSGGSGGSSSSATYTLLYSFEGVNNDGQSPDASLIQATDDNLYGTTYAGGAQNAGTVFRMTPGTGAETVLYSFGTGTDGEHPAAALMEGSDGNLYGTTYTGGTQNAGTVFEISLSGSETVLYSFGSVAGDGANPAAALRQGSDGNLYGTTYQGGADNDGTIFSVSPSTKAEVLLHSFSGPTGDGAGPGAVLIQDSNGTLYGTTLAGGTFNDGTIFQLTPGSGAESTVYSFGAGINDAEDPDASGLIKGSDGNFYGTTLEGGAHGAKLSTGGTVFSFSTGSGNDSIVYSFGSFSGDGAQPGGGVIQGSDGNLYGTTSNGGSYQSGTVFMVTPSGAETILYSFGSVSGDGDGPAAGLIQASDGSFYGTTSTGGANNLGTVFEVTPK
jgi:uncharacterized repeat protein (TIGR03803 family)